MEIRNLSKSYDGKTVFSGLNLSLEEGGAYCLMAPSGAGKTTLLRILLGLETADFGTVSGLEGKRMAAVFQDDRLLEGRSALQNLLFAVGDRRPVSELNEALLKLLPENALTKQVCDFSGGMRRRVEILRALLAPSDVILMDEPFSGLDIQTKRETAAVINGYASGKLLIVATHSPEDAGLLNAAVIRLDSPSA